MTDLPATEPLRILIASDGQPIVVPASVGRAISWSLVKWRLMRDRGFTAEAADAEIARLMALEGPSDA